MRAWVDWRGYLRADRPDLAVTFDSFIVALKELYAQFTPEFAADETGVDAAQIVAGGARASAVRAAPSARTTGDRRPPATSGAGRSRAACTCSSC